MSAAHGWSGAAALDRRGGAPPEAAAGQRDGHGCKHADKEAEPFGSTTCPGVRPGGLVHIDLPPEFARPLPVSHCTLGFLWRSGGERYISTAGHCAADSDAWDQWAGGDRPVAYDADRRRIGEVVYSRWSADPSTPGKPPVAPDLDFALIRLDRGVDADPAVCHFGGPDGIDGRVIGQTFTPPNLIEVRYYRNGFAGGNVPGVGPVLPARTGFTHGLPSKRVLHFSGHLSHRDSGGPILTGDGRAIALISSAGVAEGSYVGTARSPRLPHQVKHAEAELGVELELVTAPRS